MNATDFVTLLPIFVGALAWILGEWRRDNVYRTVAAGAMINAIVQYAPSPGAVAVLSVLALYLFVCWFFQPGIRPKME